MVAPVKKDWQVRVDSSPNGLRQISDRLSIDWMILAGLIIPLALWLRLNFAVGMVNRDDFAYAQAAHAFISGNFRAINRVALLRPGVFGPVALSYGLFGVHDFSTLWWPLFSSLVGVVTIFFLGRLMADHRAGLLAAFLLAVSPLDIPLATQLLPDGILSTFMALSVLFFLLGEKLERRADYGYLGLSFLFLVGALATKPVAIILILFFLAYALWQRRFAGLGLMIGLFLLTGLLMSLVLWLSGGNPLTFFLQRLFYANVSWQPSLTTIATKLPDWFQLATRHAVFFPLIFITLVALAASLAQRPLLAPIPLLWLSTTFLYFEVGPAQLSAYSPYSAQDHVTRYLSFITIPLILLLTTYLVSILSQAQVRWLTLIAGGAVALVTWQAPYFWPGNQPYLLFSSLAGALALFLGLASPLFALGQSHPWRVTAISSLVLLLSLSGLHEAQQKAKEGGAGSHFAIVFNFLRTLSPLPVYVAEQTWVGNGLNYYNGFEGVQHFQVGKEIKTEPILQLADDPPTGNGYIIVDPRFIGSRDDPRPDRPVYLQTPPPTWWLIGQPAATPIYRILDETASRKEQKSYLRGVAETPASAYRYFRLAGAYLNGGQWAEATQAFGKALTLDPDYEGAQPGLRTAYEQYARQNPQIQEGENLLQNGEFNSGLANWDFYPAARASLVFGVDEQVGHADKTSQFALGENFNYHGGLYQAVNLEPGRAYLFSAYLKIENLDRFQVNALYWQYTDQTGQLQQGWLGGQLNQVSTNWTYVQNVIVIPEFAQPEVLLYPALISNRGKVWVDEVKLIALPKPELF